MAFAITQNCCTDASCLSVCPVNCIHPTPGEPDFGRTELLHIDPRSCIDCGACVDACPVDAIAPVATLAPAQAGYAAVNADYFTGRIDEPVRPGTLDLGSAGAGWDHPVFPPTGLGSLGQPRVAIVGTGPAACYAADELLRITDARVTFFDRLTTPGGLARFGVAPDHVATRKVGQQFERVRRNPRVRLRLGVEVGTDIPRERLARDFDAVVYAIGAAGDRELAVPGEDSAGVLGARTFVGWYNGHPEIAPDAVRLDGCTRVVIIGNGNVALDAARILSTDPERLNGTAIAPHALAALRRSDVREVVVIGRRGAEHAAFTRGECLALQHIPGLEVVVEERSGVVRAIEAAAPASAASALRGLPLRPVDFAAEPAPGRRIVFSFGHPVTQFRRRAGAVDTVLRDEAGDVTVPAGLVLRAIGYRGRPQPGLGHDPVTGAIANRDGRVIGPDGEPLPATYVVGWAKRGPIGGIGANKACAAQTVQAIITDLAGTADM